MAKNAFAKNGLTEYVDMAVNHLRDIAERAFYDVCVDNGANIPKGKKAYLEADADEFDTRVFELMREQVKNGMVLEKSLSGS